MEASLCNRLIRSIIAVITRRLTLCGPAQALIFTSITMSKTSAGAYDRSWSERVFHAFMFEVLAIGISAPLAAWLTGKSILDMGVLTAVIAAMALAWNVVYNWGFDRIQRRHGFARSVWVRIAHATGFEVGLIFMAVPFVAWWLDVTLWHALVVDIGLVLFYLPYTFVYNLVYDTVRARVMARRAARQASSAPVPVHQTQS